MPDTPSEIMAMAEEIFELSLLGTLARARMRADSPVVFSESEFLALDIIAKRQKLTIGEIQRHVGVVPAQMSRIIRSLESKDSVGYIKCAINDSDRRKVDVELTAQGKEAYESYRTFRLKSMLTNLSALADDDRKHFMRILRQIRANIESQMAQK